MISLYRDIFGAVLEPVKTTNRIRDENARNSPSLPDSFDFDAEEYAELMQNAPSDPTDADWEEFVEKNSTELIESAAMTGEEDAYFTASQYCDFRAIDALEEVSIQKVRSDRYLNEWFVKVSGKVASITPVKYVYTNAKAVCAKCGAKNTVSLKLYSGEIREPLNCQSCERQGPFEIEKRCRVPRAVAILEDVGESDADIVTHLYGDLVNVESGDSVDIVGYAFAVDDDETSNELVAEAQLVAVEAECDADVDLDLSDEKVEEIQKRASKDDFKDALVDSFAPQIQGRDNEKLAVLCSILSGAPVSVADSITGARRRSHTLLIGPPSSGKSELLKWASKISPVGEYAASDDSTSKGLTASEVEDSRLPTKHTVRSGVLPRAHQGTAALDELDKIDGAYSNLHTPLQNMEVKRSLRGETHTMPAQTAVVAAANPKNSSWSDYDDLQSQFGFEDSFLSRFDTVWAIQNNSMSQAGEEIADSIINSLTEDASEVAEFHSDWLQQYVYVARQHDPSVNKEVYKICQSAWQDLIPDGENAESREFLSLIRLSMAFSRMEFADELAPRHAQQAIELWKSSLETYAIGESGEIDMGMLRDGVSSEVQDRRNEVLELVGRIEEEENRGVTPPDLYDNLGSYDAIELDETVETLMEQGILYRLPEGESGKFARV